MKKSKTKRFLIFVVCFLVFLSLSSFFYLLILRSTVDSSDVTNDQWTSLSEDENNDDSIDENGYGLIDLEDVSIEHSSSDNSLDEEVNDSSSVVLSSGECETPDVPIE